jgi:polar amino acid transport system substrate-binding protein
MRKGIRASVFTAVVVVVAVLAVLAGIYIGKTVYGPSTAAHKYLVVGTNIPFPPFEDLNTTTGAFVGFDINFSYMIAFALHRTLQLVQFADFSVLLTTVGAGGVDMAASAITESGTTGAARNMTMSFSKPYYSANQAVLVQSSSSVTCPNKNCSAQQLKTLTVGVQTGTTSEAWAMQFLAPNMSNPSKQLLHYTTVDTEITALRAGALNAVIIDVGPANSIAGASGGALKNIGLIITGELYGFAVAHGDPQGLVPTINSVITTSIANGTYAKLIAYWFH